ncbi:MAG: O-methyltransferase [Bacteroidales bacterium]|nr:O-methyltransferase [Bacteroidales bacterium]
MESLQNKYIRRHSTPQGEALDWIERQTNVHTNFPQMLSGSVQGAFLRMLCSSLSARRVLEIGTFTGYSAVCLASGMAEGGHLDALEINDEMEDLIRAGWERAGVTDRITLHIGDALETLKSLEGPYDMVYIDANKREYASYYKLVKPLVRHGGLIVADDVMMGGKVYAEPPASDPQTTGLMEFNDMVASDSEVEVVILPVRDGLSIIRKL